ncbi:hypothetical protein HUW46_01114 [Amycolatopsis sp. CA-230715]|nr:hypothetical protein HUW46_01114 [Amycolatopsis sp. CA-230715]
MALFAVTCFAVPIALLVLTVLVQLARVHEDARHRFDLIQLVPGAIFLGCAAFVFTSRRYRPVTWSGTAVMLGVGTFFVGALIAIASIGLHESVFGTIGTSFFYFPVLVVVPLGWLLGRFAWRVLLSPPIPELAETRFELAFTWRGSRRERLTIGTEHIAVSQTYTVSSGENSHTRTTTHAYPLSTLSRAEPIVLTDDDEIRFAASFSHQPQYTLGPALRLRVQGQEWTIPVDHPDVLAELARRRAASASTAGSR